MLLEEKEGISVNIEEERAFSVNFKKKKIQAPTHIRKRACLCPRGRGGGYLLMVSGGILAEVERLWDVKMHR